MDVVDVGDWVVFYVFLGCVFYKGVYLVVWVGVEIRLYVVY